MKIVYIGVDDGLAEALVERMGQEGDDVYLLSDKALPRKPQGISLHRFCRSPKGNESFGKLLRSISPDFVIFAGNHYINSAYGEESDKDVTLLARSLRAVAGFSHVKFILLSSIEVYGNTGEKIDESAERAALSERGVRFIREEQLLNIYWKQHGMDAVILRASQLYTNRPREDAGDFLSQSFCAAVQAEGSMPNDVFQPLHVSDFVDAVKKVMDDGKGHIYNVCGSAQVSAERLYQLIHLQENLQERVIRWVNPSCTTLADSSLIRQELGWGDSRNLVEQLQRGEITYERAPAKGRKKKKRAVPTDIRQMAGNLLLFVVFFVLSSLCSSHTMFSQVGWLMIYVILVFILCNICQRARLDLGMLKDEYEDLKAINEEDV